MLDDTSSASSGAVTRAIGPAGIHDNDFIAARQAADRLANPRFFIKGNDDSGDSLH
jgi:hypothetical protein